MIDLGTKVYKGVVEDRNDPLKMGRVRVRVIGYHSDSTLDIPTDTLPWATVMQPINSAAMTGVGIAPVGPVEGTVVLLIFNDGEDMQDPIVIGSIGGIPAVPAHQTHSRMKTSVEDQKAVFNSGMKEDGSKIAPLENMSQVEGRAVDLLVVHCTATPPTHDWGVAEVDQLHRGNGWEGIGYHAVIRRNGVTEQGRSLSRVGAHAQGYNTRSIGVALVGGVDSQLRPQNNFNPAQFSALRTYVLEFLNKVPGGKVIGHNEISSKACPSFDVQAWLKDNIPEALTDSGNLGGDPEGLPREPSGDNKQDVGQNEGFSDDVVAGKASVPPATSVNGKGFIDPNGVYPRAPLVDEPDTNRLARGEESDKTIVQTKKDGVDETTSAFGKEIKEPATPYAAMYPYNHVSASESGHIQEVDDTPGAERLHRYHKSGTFEEIHPTGTRVTKIVGDDYTIVHKDGNLHVKGNINITIDGDANMKVNGATNLESVGSITAHTDSNIKMTADGRIDILATGRMKLVGSRIDLNP